MAKKLINTDVKLGSGTLLKEAVDEHIDELEFFIETKTITSTTDGSGFVYVGPFPDRTINVNGFIQTFDGKINLDLRYYHLIPVRNGNQVYFLVRTTNGSAVSNKSITFVYTITYQI